MSDHDNMADWFAEFGLICRDCACALSEGPHGGNCINYTCSNPNCGSGFNICGYHGVVFFAQRITPPHPWRQRMTEFLNANEAKHTYPDRYTPVKGGDRPLDIAWDILDSLKPGLIESHIRAYLAGRIAAAISNAREGKKF